MRTLILLTVGLTWTFATTARAAEITVAQDGQAKAVVVVAADATPPQRHAAEELAHFLGKVTGATPQITHQLDAAKVNLLVGPGAAGLADAGFTTDGLGTDGIVIRTVGRNLILAGGEPRGTLYAVYTFLEDHVGCRWWSPRSSTIPKTPTLTIGPLNVRHVPPLEYRDTNASRAKDGDFSVRNKLNGHSHGLFTDDGSHNVREDHARGGRKFAYIKSDKWSCHTFWTLLPPQVYFADHPEWYSLIDGKRIHARTGVRVHPWTSLCLTNEEMRRELVTNQLLALMWNPHTTMVDISELDIPNEICCQCPECLAAEKGGNHSDLVVRFVNSVAADIEKQFPDIVVTTLGYHSTQDPPKREKTRDNVIVRLSTIKCSFSTPLSDERNSAFREDLVGWSKMCARLYIWDYPVNHTYLLPHPNLRVLGPNLRYLIKHNVKGYFAESESLSPEMTELRTWVLAKLMWNPDMDAWALVEDFCGGYYGPAGKHVLAYLTMTHDALAATEDRLGLSSRPDAKFLSFETLSKGWKHLEAAGAAVRDDRKLHFRVEVAQLPLIYAFLYRWDELRDKAKAAGADWPMPESMRDAMKRFLLLARQRGAYRRLHQMSMPRKMLMLFKEMTGR